MRKILLVAAMVPMFAIADPNNPNDTEGSVEFGVVNKPTCGIQIHGNKKAKLGLDSIPSGETVEVRAISNTNPANTIELTITQAYHSVDELYDTVTIGSLNDSVEFTNGILLEVLNGQSDYIYAHTSKNSDELPAGNIYVETTLLVNCYP